MKLIASVMFILWTPNFLFGYSKDCYLKDNKKSYTGEDYKYPANRGIFGHDYMVEYNLAESSYVDPDAKYTCFLSVDENNPQNFGAWIVLEYVSQNHRKMNCERISSASSNPISIGKTFSITCQALNLKSLTLGDTYDLSVTIKNRDKKTYLLKEFKFQKV